MITLPLSIHALHYTTTDSYELMNSLDEMKQEVITRGNISVEYLPEYKMFKFSFPEEYKNLIVNDREDDEEVIQVIKIHNVRGLCKSYNTDYYHAIGVGIHTTLEDIPASIRELDYRLTNTGFSLEDCWYIRSTSYLDDYYVKIGTLYDLHSHSHQDNEITISIYCHCGDYISKNIKGRSRVYVDSRTDIIVDEDIDLCHREIRITPSESDIYYNKVILGDSLLINDDSIFVGRVNADDNSMSSSISLTVNTHRINTGTVLYSLVRSYEESTMLSLYSDKWTSRYML